MYCGEANRAEQVVPNCSRWYKERMYLGRRLGDKLSVETVVSQMVESQPKWWLIRNFVATVTSTKEAEHRGNMIPTRIHLNS